MRLNWPELATRGFLVPDARCELTDNVSGQHLWTFYETIVSGQTAELAAKLQFMQMSARDAQHVLLSAENLSNDGSAARLKEVFSGLNCRVIVYIRRQDEFLASSWQQWYSKKFEDINAWLISALPAQGHWLRCIREWEDVVGKGKVIVRLYQRSDLLNGDIVDDFFHEIGVNAGDPTFSRPSSPNINPSFSNVVTPLVTGNKGIFLNEHDNHFYEMVLDLTGERYDNRDCLSLFSREQRNAIIDFYSEENEKLRLTYLSSRSHLFDPIDHNIYEYPEKGDLQGRQLAFVTDLIYQLYKRLSDRSLEHRTLD